MKIFLIILASFYFVGCGKSSKDSKDSKDSETLTKHAFTLTHNDPKDSTSLFIYIDDKKSPLSNADIEPYKVPPGTCFGLTSAHFSDLKVKAIFAGEFKTLCGDSAENKCQPGHYNINDEPSFGVPQYVLKSTDQANNSDSCIDIETWIKSNKPIETT